MDDKAIADQIERHSLRSVAIELEDSFTQMALSVVDRSATEPVLIAAPFDGGLDGGGANEARTGLRYQGRLYRLSKSVASAHRLQAFCWARRLQERSAYVLITQSAGRFSVWIECDRL